jgi:mannose-1-phosphate guanylyltransferase
MAGGGGTRLRPVSTAERPKPFIPLLPTGQTLLEGQTLLQRTVARLRGPELDGLGDADIAVVAAAAYAPLIEAQLPGIRLVAEPEGRNTAAAIALATLAIERDEDDVMIVLPADHLIDTAREGVFRRVLADAATGLAAGRPFEVEDPLVTLGVQPSGPSTQYGYLVPRAGEAADVGGLRAYPLDAFREKPPLADAERLWRSAGVAWNAGMFLWRRRAIRAALERYVPAVVEVIGGGLARGALTAAYASLAARSIDYEVMEPAARDRRVVMGAMDVGWSDIGSWPALLEALGVAGIEGSVVEAGTSARTSAGDLVVDRDAGGLTVRPAADGTITPQRPVAVLREAEAAHAVVQALVDRCAAAEARA